MAGDILWANRAALRTLGAIEGRPLGDIVLNREASVARLFRLAGSASRAVAVRLEFPQGARVWHAWRVVLGEGADPRLLLQQDANHELLSKFLVLKRESRDVAADRDRTLARAARLRQEAARLQAMMRLDSLTGILNAGGIEDHTRRTLSRPGTRGIFVFADLDGFKSVNDRFGHDAGDAVLQALARRFDEAVRVNDRVARIGGDEFAFWFDGMSHADVEPTLRRLASLASHPVDWTDPATGAVAALCVGASFGAAIAPTDGCTFSVLKAVADARMYEQKWRKRGCPAR